MSRRELFFIILSGAVIFLIVFFLVYKVGGGNVNLPKIGKGSTPTPASSEISNSVIKVTSPYKNQNVKTPFKISGQAKVFENQFNYRVTDSLGRILGEGTIKAESETLSGFAPFDVTVSSLADIKGKGQVEIFDYSPKDGSVINKLVIPVNIE